MSKDRKKQKKCPPQVAKLGGGLFPDGNLEKIYMQSLAHEGPPAHPCALEALKSSGSDGGARADLQALQQAPSEARQVVGDVVALGTSRITLPPLPPGDIRRRVRLTRRQRSSAWLIGQARLDAGESFNAEPGITAKDPSWVRPPRPARCRWRVAPQVSVHGAPGGTAHFSGTERCASIWACPVCSPVIRAGRAEDISAAVEKHRSQGGKFLFLTLTLRHYAQDALDLTLNAALQAWTKLIAGSPWQRQKNSLGIQGYVRSVEITRGKNGWHPHVHALIFLEQTPSDEALETFENWISTRWADKIVSLGASMPSREHGVDIRRADDASTLALYLSKVQEKKISMELARGDLKDGRGGSINPFDLLDQPIQDATSRGLWIEYVIATKGRRAITWSNGLRDSLLLKEELTDEQILEETEAEQALEIISAETWDQKKNSPNWLAMILEEAELPSPQLARIIRSIDVEGEFIDPITGELMGRTQSGAPPLIAEQKPEDPGSQRAAKPAKRTLDPAGCKANVEQQG